MEQRDFGHPRTPGQFLRLFLTGFAMGASDIVPGVSGGTMAFILGIYETLINGIKSFNLTALRLALGLKFQALFAHIPFGFLIAVGVGILTAVFSLSSLLSSALEHQPVFIFAFFGGLILASILAIAYKIRWGIGTVISLVAAAAFAFVIVGLPGLKDADHSLPVLFLSGMVAICAMILPGISGSFILLILGQYEFVLNAVKALDMLSLIAVALGAVVGLMGFSRVLSWLLKNYHQITIAALVGFMGGSLRRIWEEVSAGTSRMSSFGVPELLLAVALLAFGFVLVSFLDHLQSRQNPLIARVWRPREATQPETGGADVS